MSRPIQTRPLGYLSLLALKNLGVNPEVAQDSMQPVMDITQLYLADKVRTSRVGIITLVDGNVGLYADPTQTVPTGEVWWVLGHSIELLGQLGVPVGEITRVRPAAIFNYNLPTTAVDVGLTAAEWIGNTRPVNHQRGTATFGRQYIAPAGTGCGFYAEKLEFTTGRVDVYVDLVYVPLLI